MQYLTPQNIGLASAVLFAVAHLVQGLCPPATLAHKIADKVLALGPNLFDLLGVGPDKAKS